MKLTIVDFVSDSLYDAGDPQITIVVFALPPSDSCRIRVNLESLKIFLRCYISLKMSNLLDIILRTTGLNSARK